MGRRINLQKISTGKPVFKIMTYLKSQKKGYLLRSIVAKKFKDEHTPVEDPVKTQVPKRARFSRGYASSMNVSARSTSCLADHRDAGDTGVQEQRNKTTSNQRSTSTTDLNEYEDHTVKLRDQIAKFFGTATGCQGKPAQLEPVSPSWDDDPVQKTVDPYALDIVTAVLESEFNDYPTTSTKELERQITKRTDVVKCIMRIGLALKLLYQSIHLATYITDAYMKVQCVPCTVIELFAATALYIAAKQEETDYNQGPEPILKLCSSTMRYSTKRLISMEARILIKLKFRLCCPTSQFFMEACASQMTYSDKLTKQFTINLAQGILLHSLGQPDLMCSPNSKKARLALAYAVKYVCYNYPLLEKVHTTDKGIWEKFRQKCFPEFRSAALQGVTVPKTIALSASPSALQDMTNKGCRRTSISKSCTAIAIAPPSSRTTWVK